MSTPEYRTWNGAGRPYSLAQPIYELKSHMRAADVEWLGDLGNEDHLQSNNPEDHTPYSYTAWPIPLPGYIVCAIDGAQGKWCDRLLAAAKDGRAPWVKYMNFRNVHYNIKNGWSPEYSSDYHGHVSIRTDHINTRDIYNPFTDTTPTGEIDMLYLAQVHGSQAVWKGNGIDSTFVADPATLDVLQANGARWLPPFPTEAAMFNAIGPSKNYNPPMGGSGTGGLSAQEVEDAAFRGAQRAEKE